MPPSRHPPERTCIACRARAPQRELARFVADPSDAGGYRLRRADARREPGRGLYVCRSEECFSRAAERRAFHRAARLDTGEHLTIDQDLAVALRAGS
ncbi:MAG: YlxR family protein [Thermoleophilia bacterium]|nr:YlxR family protein [Thermoleophilia bacterium]MDH3725178.1 YlxR family protein [Thermoleophilia bacterium]